MDQLDQFINRDLRGYVGYPDYYNIERIGRNTIILEPKGRPNKSKLIDEIKYNPEFRDKFLYDLINAIRTFESNVDSINISFQGNSININLNYDFGIRAPSVSTNIKYFTQPLQLPVEIFSIISSYLEHPDLRKLLTIYNQFDNNFIFWNTYLSLRHPYLTGRKFIFNGDPLGVDKILSYYDTGNFYKSTPETIPCDEYNKAHINDDMKVGLYNHFGSVYHYNMLEKLYEEYPVEFNSLVWNNLIRKEDHRYLLT